MVARLAPAGPCRGRARYCGGSDRAAFRKSSWGLPPGMIVAPEVGGEAELARPIIPQEDLLRAIEFKGSKHLLVADLARPDALCRDDG